MGTYIYNFLVAEIQEPNEKLIAITGFLEAQAQFNYLFLTPLKIADKYRLTQEVTPAGTLIST